MAEPVSVIVTCHNLARFIGEAIRSVLSQDYGGAVEIVVVDDCSTDGSADAIRGFPEARHVRTEMNVGVLLATIRGLESVTHDLVFFLDGDDVWESSKLSRTVPAFGEAGVALVTHDLSFIGPDGALSAQRTRSETVLGSCDAERTALLVREGILRHGDYVWLGSAYAIRQSLSDVTGFCRWAKALPDPTNTYQDWTLAYWVASRPDAKTSYVPDKLFRYRVHGANYSGDTSSVEKAVRNVGRARNTTAATLDIGLKARVERAALRATRQKLRYNLYLLDLYRDRRLRALGGFFMSLPWLLRNSRQLPKEFLRLVAIEALGARAFVSRITQLRHQPPRRTTRADSG